MSDAHGGSPAAQPPAGSSTTQAGLLVDVAGESSTDKAADRSAPQPVVDLDAAGAIPEDNFTKCDLLLFNTVR